MEKDFFYKALFTKKKKKKKKLKMLKQEGNVREIEKN